MIYRVVSNSVSNLKFPTSNFLILITDTLLILFEKFSIFVIFFFKVCNLKKATVTIVPMLMNVLHHHVTMLQVA